MKSRMKTVVGLRLLAGSAFVASALAAYMSVADASGPTLYDRIGGEAKMRATVHEFVLIMESDDRINFTFANTDLKKFEQLLFEQLCNITDGGCKYTGRDMYTAHAKLNITNAEFNALAEDLYEAFDRLHVPYRYQNQVVALLAPMQKDVVKDHVIPQDTAPPPAGK
jgi:hemoglobin